jgi:hypothetical protein
VLALLRQLPGLEAIEQRTLGVCPLAILDLHGGLILDSIFVIFANILGS